MEMDKTDEIKNQIAIWNYLLKTEFNLRERMQWEAENGPYPSVVKSATSRPSKGIRPSKSKSIRPSKEKLQAWWEAAAKVWQEYPRMIARGITLEQPPTDLAGVMALMCGYLAVGKLPDPIAEAIGEGRTQIGPTEQRDIGLAVAYHQATKPSGLTHNNKQIFVVDKTPSKTISAKYAVKPGTVRGWTRKYKPTFLGVNDVDAALLNYLMEEAGKRYAAAGRSHTAIRKRSA